MASKIPSDFNSHEAWLSYIRENIPVSEQPYVHACGRTELFKSFCAVRNCPFAAEFTQELEKVGTYPEPERTRRLEELNNRIFADITGFLFAQTKKAVRTDDSASVSSRGRIEELRTHLIEKNRYFALWITYKEEMSGDSPSLNWEQYLGDRRGLENEDDIAFIRAMAELDKLLLFFHHNNRMLPKYFYERCWFLHHLHGSERMLQTRALLNILTAETGACASV